MAERNRKIQILKIKLHTLSFSLLALFGLSVIVAKVVYNRDSSLLEPTPASVRATPSNAQATAYYFYRPSAEQYLEALPQIMTQAAVDYNGQNQADYSVFQELIQYELTTHYTDLSSVKFDTLDSATAYVTLSPYNGDGLYSEAWWHRIVVDAYLRENHIDLAAQRQWHFGNYTINLTPASFSGRKQPELIAEITYTSGGYLPYHELEVLERDDSAPGKYRRVKIPYPLVFSDDCTVHEFCAGGAQTFAIQDVTGSGLPEWLVATHSCGYGECGGTLWVLGWRADEMVDLVSGSSPLNRLRWDGTDFPAASLPPPNTWTFLTDSSGQSLIIQRYQFHDNRDCVVTYSTVLTWDRQKDRFAVGNVVTSYDNSAACALRKGEADLFSGDYPDAISDYEQAVTLLMSNADSSSREARQYAQIRLALAYALAGKSTQALAVREQLKNETPETPLMAPFINAALAYDNAKDALKFCAAMYEAVPSSFNFPEDDVFWGIGQTDDVPDRPANYVGGDYGPDTSGCNLANVVLKVARDLNLTVDTSPLESLQASGFDVVAQFHADLNSDKQTDWLFWLGGVSDQVLVLLSNGNHYQASWTSIDIPDTNSQLTTFTLPDGAGTGLVRLNFGDKGNASDQPGSTCGDNKPSGSVDVWRIENKTLSTIGSYLLCEPRLPQQIFITPQKLTAWYSFEYNSVAIQTTFIWNAKDKTYDPPQPPPSEAKNGPMLTNIFYQMDGFDSDGWNSLTVLTAALDDRPQGNTPSFLGLVHYRRGLLFEQLGNRGAALKDFRSIFDSPATPAWKMVAALHLKLSGS